MDRIGTAQKADNAVTTHEEKIKTIYEDNISSAPAGPSPESAEFKQFGFAVIRSLIKHPLVRALYQYSIARASRGTMKSDSQVPGTPAAYGDPAMEELLVRTMSVIESVTGVEVYPTYSYFRVYKHADVLQKHTDRSACELSLSVCLGYIADESWPIWVEAGEPKRIVLMPGDALLYKGAEIAHWRDEFEGTKAVQAFLHYVCKDGPHSACRFDERRDLSTLSKCAEGPTVLSSLERLVKPGAGQP